MNLGAELAQPVENKGWEARLKLSALGGRPRTRIWKEHQGPLYLQKPFYPEEDGTAHLYLLHPPGGVVSGDQLHIRMDLKERAAVLVTTPGSGKFYRSSGLIATQQQQFALASGTRLEWFPQETILYEGSQTRLSTSVQLQEGASYIGWEILCFGRPASAISFGDGVCHQRLEIWQDQQPLWIDRAVFDGGSGILESNWGLGSFTVYGTCVATLADAAMGARLVEEIRQSVQPANKALFSVTLCNSVLVCRYLGQVAEQAKQLFTEAWHLIRLALLHKGAIPPRIWNT